MEETDGKDRNLSMESVLETYLLEVENIHNFYERWVRKQLGLILTVNEIYKEEENTNAIVGNEVLRRRNKDKHWKGLQTWNDGIKVAIKKKDKSYRGYLQKRTVEAKQIHCEANNMQGQL